MRATQTDTLLQSGKARRVYLLLRDEIANGHYMDQPTLPGEQRLADTFGVSRVTVRRALAALSSDGLVERRAGRETRIMPPPATTQVTADFATLLPQLVEMGHSTSARVLSFSYGPAPKNVREALALTHQDRVQIATRVRRIKGQPFSHLTTYVPEDIARTYDKDDLAQTPLFQLLERGGVQIDTAQQSVSAGLATPDVAAALDVAEGSALMSLSRVVSDTRGRAVEYLAALYRPDMFRLDMTLARVGDADARQWEPRIGAASLDGLK